MRDLELERHGLHVEVHEPYLFAPFPDGRSVVTWSSRERTREQLARDWSAADADGYAEFADRWDAAAARARPLLSEPASRERWLEAVGPGILDGSVAAELEGIPSEEVRVPFAIQGLIGTLAGPDDPGTAFVGFYHDLGQAAGVEGAWGYARGGMGAVTGALRSAAEAAGARVRLEAPVERVLMDDEGAATGVVLEGGEEIRARVVLSNADPVRTARLAGVDTREGWRQAGPVVKVMVLLDGLPDFPAWPGEEPWRGAIDIGFTLGDLERAASEARGGRPAARPWIEAACQTATDDSLAPPGRHVLSLFCQCFPPDVDAEVAADSAIQRFTEVCPDLPARIVDRLALGPRAARGALRDRGRPHLPRRDAARAAAGGPPGTAAVRGRRAPLPGRIGRPPGRCRERRTGPAGRARGHRGPGRRVSEAIARGLYDAFGRGDYDGMFAQFHPDVRFDLSNSGIPGLTGSGSGHAAMREAWVRWRSGWDSYDLRPCEYIVVGDKVLVLMHVTARSRRQGLELERRFADLLTCRDGLIVEFANYADWETARSELGLDP